MIHTAEDLMKKYSLSKKEKVYEVVVEQGKKGFCPHDGSLGQKLIDSRPRPGNSRPAAGRPRRPIKPVEISTINDGK